jgi:nitrite reductase/ring-hydroxylating ferredoxin subunit
MLSREENELLTRVGAGTPMGDLMRRYWIPAVFSHQIAEPDSPPVRVRLLGEDLVAFRDTHGRVGLLDQSCPHRTASLFFGRNEECGLRCVYHGWKFDVDGNCVDLPSEPPGSRFQNKVRIKAYPCLERGGVVWSYMGPSELKPDFPDLEWANLPDRHRFSSRRIQQCNWLQGLEGGFDSSHLAFLHGGTSKGNVTIPPSRYEVVPTEFGFVAGAGREVENDQVFWTANVMLMPFHKIVASVPVGAHVWAPIDDENTMLYCIDFLPHRPVTEEDLAREKSWNGIHAETLPGTDIPVRNRDNDYLIDRALQGSGESYTGIKGLGVQDSGIQESMGPIADRTKEHLGVSDTAIITIRKLLLKTLRDFAEGSAPPGLDAASCQVRSSRYKAPKELSFADTVHSHISLESRVAAE